MTRAFKNFIIMFSDFENLSEEQEMSIREYRIKKIESCLNNEDIIMKRMINGVYGRFSSETIEAIRKSVDNVLIEEDRVVSIEMKHAGGLNQIYNLNNISDFLNYKNGIFNESDKSYCNYFNEVKRCINDNEINKDEYDSENEMEEATIITKTDRYAPWGLCALNESDSRYKYIKNGGKGVSVYVIDTGIDTKHNEFKGRVRWGYNGVEGSIDGDDNGHGTHCAGVIGGSKHGVARGVDLVAVKVLNQDGKGMISKILEGIDFVIKDHIMRMEDFYNTIEKKMNKKKLVFNDMFNKNIIDKNKNNNLRNNKDKLILINIINDRIEKVDDSINLINDNIDIKNNTADTINENIGMKNNTIDSLNEKFNLKEIIRKMEKEAKNKVKSVVNLSIGGIKSASLNFAIDYAASKYGIHFVSAAGNEHENACEYSPASAKSALTVGACNSEYNVASFSNHGGCVDLYAPGVEIESAWPGNHMKNASGTSMASPHVAGIMAIYLGLSDFKPEVLKTRLILDGLPKMKVSEKTPFASLINLYKRLDLT